MNGQAVILLSGGLDSGVLLAWSQGRYEKIHGLYFDYGSRHTGREYEKARELASQYGASLQKIELPFIHDLFSSSLLKSGEEIPEGPYASGNISSTVVPFRNGIMISIAIGYAENLGISKVLIASHSGDHPIYPDCRQSFTAAMSKAAQEGTFNKVAVLAPFAEYVKKDIADLGRKMGFDFRRTYSCYKGFDIHCGKCATCIERKAALSYDQGLDPTEYLQ